MKNLRLTLIGEDGYVFVHDFVRQVVSLDLSEQLGERGAEVGREHSLVAHGLEQLEGAAAG